MQVLEKKLQDTQNSLKNRNLFQDTEEQIIKLKQDIAEIIEEKTRGAMLRCRADWSQLGEKPTQYCLNMEKRNKNRRTIDVLIRDDGSRVTFPDYILREQSKFCEVLHRSRQDKLLSSPTYLQNCKILKLDENERLFLEEPIVIEEVIEAIKSLKSGRASGVDGLLEIYKKCSRLLAPLLLLELFKDILQKKQMHLSARREVITLLEKTGKNPSYLVNWRPLSLPNNDHKIFAKIWAT